MKMSKMIKTCKKYILKYSHLQATENDLENSSTTLFFIYSKMFKGNLPAENTKAAIT